MNFIKENTQTKKTTLSTPIIRIDSYNAHKANESFVSSLKESDMSYITYCNIIFFKKCLYKNGLHLKRKRFYHSCWNFPVFYLGDWLLNNQTITNENSEYQMQDSDNTSKGIRYV